MVSLGESMKAIIFFSNAPFQDLNVNLTFVILLSETR